MDLKIKSLHYTNSLGTDLTVYFSENTIWKNADKGDIIVNMPSYEIFTSPDFRKTEGIVYSAKPLVRNDKLVDKFWLKFKKGKVVDYDAEIGKDLLDAILNTDKYSSYLGEAALISYDSPISNTGVIFYTTLFDENASCHLALGNGFSNTIKDGNKLSKKKLISRGINQSEIHVDFMIGTEDLNITAETYNGEIVDIFKNGNFCI
jgi:aminopeptidase